MVPIIEHKTGLCSNQACPKMIPKTEDFAFRHILRTLLRRKISFILKEILNNFVTVDKITQFMYFTSLQTQADTYL